MTVVKSLGSRFSRMCDLDVFFVVKQDAAGYYGVVWSMCTTDTILGPFATEAEAEEALKKEAPDWGVGL